MKTRKLTALIIAVMMIISTAAVTGFAADVTSILQTVSTADGSYYLYDFNDANMATFMNQVDADADDSALYYYDSMYTAVDALTAENGGPALNVQNSVDSYSTWTIVNFNEDIDAANHTWARIVYKYDNVSLAEAATEEKSYNAWIRYGTDDIVNYATATVTEGETIATIANSDNEAVAPGKWATSVVQLPVANGGALSVAPMYSDDDYLILDTSIKYIALFASEYEAKNFDPSVTAVSIGDTALDVDIFAHTATMTLADDATIEDLPFTDADVALTLSNATATPQTSAAVLSEASGVVTAEIKYDVVNSIGETVVWSVKRAINVGSDIYDYSNITADYIANYITNSNCTPTVGDGALTLLAGGAMYQQTFQAAPDHDPTKNWVIKIVYKVDNVQAINETGRFDICWDNAADWTIKTNTEGFWGESIEEVSTDWRTVVLKLPVGKAGGKLQTLFQGIKADVSIKYFGLFATEDEANAYDPSIQGATIYGNYAIVDKYAHTATINVAEDEEIPDFTSDDVAFTFYSGETAVAKAASAVLSETPAMTTKYIKYDVTALDGTVTEWTVQYSLGNDLPGRNYVFLDFSDSTNVSSMLADQTMRVWNSTNAAPANATSNSSALRITRDLYPEIYFQGYSKYNISPTTSDWYIKIMYKFNSVAMRDGFEQAALYINWYLQGERGGKNSAATWTADNMPEVDKWYTSTLIIPKSGYTENDGMQILFQNLNASIDIKYIAMMQSASDIKVVDQAVEYAKIGDTWATVDGVAHTATVNLANNISVEDMQTFSADDVKIFTYGEGATDGSAVTLEPMSNTATVEELEDKVIASIKYKATTGANGNGLADDKALIWTVQTVSKNTNYVKKEFVFDFSDPDATDNWVAAETFVKWGATNPSTFTSAYAEDTGYVFRVGGGNAPGWAVAHKKVDLNPSKDYYVKAVYEFDNFSIASGKTEAYLEMGWYNYIWANRLGNAEWSRPLKWTAETLPETNKWQTLLVKSPKSNKNETWGFQFMIEPATLTMNYKHLIFLDADYYTEEQAAAYDMSVVSANIGATEGKIDRVNHVVSFDGGADGDIVDVEFAMYNEESVNGAATILQNGEVEEKNGVQTVKYIVTDISGNKIDWTVTVGTAAPVPSATITKDGNTVKAAYANAENAGVKVLAVYSGDVLVKVETVSDKEEVSVTGLDAGSYTVKAFLWESMTKLTPVIDPVVETLSI